MNWESAYYYMLAGGRITKEWWMYEDFLEMTDELEIIHDGGDSYIPILRAIDLEGVWKPHYSCKLKDIWEK